MYTRWQAAALDGVLSELASEKEGRARLGERLARLEALQVAETAEQQSQAAAALSDKEGLVGELAGLRVKVSSLQVDLDNSVAVQNDFVRLSQSLQVELEKIRQSEKEVITN